MFDNNIVIATQHVIDRYFSLKPKDISSHSENFKRETSSPSRKTLVNAVLIDSSPDLECQIRTHIIKITSNTVNHLFGCLTPSTATTKDLARLDVFITRIFRRSNLPLNNLLTALLYLVRLKEYHPSCKGSLGSGHRLFLAALMMANKYLHDGAYHNKTWYKIVDKYYQLHELNQMESELLSLLRFELVVKGEDWAEFVDIMDGKLTRSWKRKGIYGPSGCLYRQMTVRRAVI